MKVEEILQDQNPAIRDTTLQLRELIRNTIPSLTEKVYPGWHCIGLQHPHAGYIGGLIPQSYSVRLFFEHGRQLHDPHGVLIGDELKQGRYLDLNIPEQIPENAIRQLLLEAIRLK